MFRFLIVFICIFFSIASHAKPANAEECGDFAKEINKYLPQSMDKITVLNSIRCLPPIAKKQVLQYRESLSVSKDKINMELIPAIKSNLSQTACTTADQRKILNMFDIEYLFVDMSGSFVTRFLLQVEDCKN